MRQLSLLHPPPPPTAIYTLSLHDALPISSRIVRQDRRAFLQRRLGVRNRTGVYVDRGRAWTAIQLDRKSTRLNSSHLVISYAVFCLKKQGSTDHKRLSKWTRDHEAPTELL